MTSPEQDFLLFLRIWFHQWKYNFILAAIIFLFLFFNDQLNWIK